MRRDGNVARSLRRCRRGIGQFHMRSRQLEQTILDAYFVRPRLLVRTFALSVYFASTILCDVPYIVRLRLPVFIPKRWSLAWGQFDAALLVVVFL